MKELTLDINGKPHHVRCDETTILIHVLRSALELIGTRQGCGLEQCGACRVLVDDEPAYACTLLAADCEGKAVTTIESADPLLEKLRVAFLELNAGQCGFCLSGILVSSLKLLRENPVPDRQAVQSALSDHLCRCGAHNRIIDAVLKAAVS